MARYSSSIKYDDVLTGNVTVSALLGALKCVIEYENKKLNKTIFVFGIPIRKKHIEEAKKGNLSAEDDGVKETTINPIDKEKWEEPELTAPSNYGILNESKESPDNKEKSTFDKIKEGYHFLTDESNQRLVSLVKQTILDLIKHILPRKIDGDFEFGFSSPDLTGKVLEIFVLLYATMGDRLKVRPNWNKEMFYGKMSCEGKFSIIYVAFKLFKVWRDKDFMKWRIDHNV